MSDLEVIVVDDASTDGTASVIEKIHNPRIRLLRSGRNIRYAAAKNLGLRNARGRWVAFLDADDEWTPKRLEHLLCAADGDEDCYVADLEVLSVPGPSGRLVRFGQPRQPEDGQAVPMDLEAFLALGHDVRPMIPLAAFLQNGIEFPEWGSCGEWTYLVSRFLAKGLEGRVVHRVGYLYRAQACHDSSTLRGKEEMVAVFEMLARDASFPESSRASLAQRAEGVRQGLVTTALREGNIAKALAYARRYPGTLLKLPRRALLYLVANARVFRASAGVSGKHAAPEARI